MKKIWEFIKNIPSFIFGASFGLIGISTMIFIFVCMIACGILLFGEALSFIFRISNIFLQKTYEVLIVEYHSNNILFIKYVCLIILSSILALFLFKYIYKYKKVKKSISSFYVTYTTLTEEQKRMIPELFKHFTELAYLRMKGGNVSLDSILGELKSEITKQETLHPDDINYILQKLPYKEHKDFGKKMSLLKWIDYYSIQKEIELDYWESDLSYLQRDMITVNIPIIKRYFMDSVKHGIYDEDKIIGDIDNRFSSVLKVLCWQDRNYFRSKIPNLYCIDDDFSYTLHEYLENAKKEKPAYIEGSIFNKE